MTASREEDFVGALTAQLPALRRYATALVGNLAMADDLVQDCVERALRQWTSLGDLQRIGGWLRAILHNVHIDDLRRRRRQGVSVDLSLIENDIATAPPQSDVAAGLDLTRALANLSFEHRQILLLVGLEGLDYRSAAAELGVPVGTVMSRLARARERLRYELEFPPVAPMGPKS